MAKKEVVVAITKKGIATDFTGYKGGKCFDVAAEIRRRLLKLGVTLDPQSSEPKDEGPDGDGMRVTTPEPEQETN